MCQAEQPVHVLHCMGSAHTAGLPLACCAESSAAVALHTQSSAGADEILPTNLAPIICSWSAPQPCLHCSKKCMERTPCAVPPQGCAGHLRSPVHCAGQPAKHEGLGGPPSWPCCMPEVPFLICTVQGSNDFVEDLGMEQPTRMDLDFVAHGLGDEDAKHAVRASDYRLPRSARRPGAQVRSDAGAGCGPLWGFGGCCLTVLASPAISSVPGRAGCSVQSACSRRASFAEPSGACTHLPGDAATCSCTVPPCAEIFWISLLQGSSACGETFTQHSNLHNMQHCRHGAHGQGAALPTQRSWPTSHSSPCCRTTSPCTWPRCSSLPRSIACSARWTKGPSTRGRL